MKSFWCFIVTFEHISHLFSSVPIVDFEKVILFNCYFAVPRPTLGHYRGDSLTHAMLITAFLHIRPEGHREPRN